MMLAYYYLISSLPMLKKGEMPPLSSPAFLSQCSNMLDKRTISRLSEIKLIPETPSPFSKNSAVGKWYDWESTLRKRLAKFRAVKLERENKNGEENNHSSIDRMIEEVLSQADPLEREKFLDSCRWRTLEDIEFGHNFDFDSLCIYRIRLMLLEKWVGKEKDKGLDNLNEIVNNIFTAQTSQNNSEVKNA